MPKVIFDNSMLKYVYVYAWVTEDSYVGHSVITTNTDIGSDAEEILRKEWKEDYGDRDEPEWECIHTYTTTDSPATVWGDCSGARG